MVVGSGTSARLVKERQSIRSVTRTDDIMEKDTQRDGRMSSEDVDVDWREKDRPDSTDSIRATTVAAPEADEEAAARKRRWWVLLLPMGMLLALSRMSASDFQAHPVMYDRRPLRSGLPAYAFQYAPLVWLAMDEEYFPSDMAAQIKYTQPRVNYTDLPRIPDPLDINTIHQLNALTEHNGSDIYLTSIIDITTSPSFLEGVRPDSNNQTRHATSCAIISVPHPTNSSVVHVFYMYFYAFNRGNTVLGYELGDHVGDWEHNMIRFVDGTPTHIWYSQHWNGEAFVYDAVEKMDGRPVTYSASGSHANYATAGSHDHLIPNVDGRWGLLTDHASQGSLWDPTLSSYQYSYDRAHDTFAAADEEGSSPLGPMLFRGQWGDEQYPSSDPRQRSFLGFWKYVGGPNGPMWKGLDRPGVCPQNQFRCIIRKGLGPLEDDEEIEDDVVD